MEKNEIKKVLYREKPIAKLTQRNGIIGRKGAIFYEAELSNGTLILFDVVVSDLGDADLLMEMPAQLLIRYLV